MSYRYAVLARITPAAGVEETIDLSAAGLISIRPSYEPLKITLTGAPPLRRLFERRLGAYGMLELDFEIDELTKERDLARVYSALIQQGARVEISLDGGGNYREVLADAAYERLPLAEKSLAGVAIALRLLAVAPDTVPPMQRIGEGTGFPQPEHPNSGFNLHVQGGQLDDWTKTVVGAVTINRETAIVYEGAASLRIDLTNGGADYGQIHTNATTPILEPGQTYQTSIYARTASTPAGARIVQVGFQFLNNGSFLDAANVWQPGVTAFPTVPAWHDLTPAQDDQWNKLTREIRTPPSVRDRLLVAFRTKPNTWPAAGILYLDLFDWTAPYVSTDSPARW